MKPKPLSHRSVGCEGARAPCRGRRRRSIANHPIGARPPCGEKGLFTKLLVSYTNLEQYDTLIDPANWPDATQLNRLRVIYGWEAPSHSLRSPFVETDDS